MTDAQWFQTRYGIRLPDGSMAPTMAGTAWTCDSREVAEKAIAYFRDGAERIGVSDWSGEIVRQLCTPWISDTDNAQLLIKELNDWLAQQTGTST